MALFMLYIVILYFTIIIDINQSADDCFYQPGHIGKRCYESDGIKYDCCPLSDVCRDGQCYSFSVTSSSKTISSETSIYIAIGVLTFALICLIIGAIYWHSRQLKKSKKEPNLLASFSASLNTPSRTTSSAGVRIHSSTTTDTNIKLETFKTNTSMN